MLMKSGNHIIDKNAMGSLWRNSQYFIEVLGEPRGEGNELIFPVKDLPFSSFKIRYDIEKKFLGKIYVMVLEAKSVQGKTFGVSERIELRYSGFFRKGNPFFITVSTRKANDNKGETLPLLNGDQRLIEECSKLDMEFLRLFFDPGKEVWKIEIRPYGGSFIHIMFPPMRYDVILVKEQADLIFSIMKRIAELIN